MRDGRDIRAQLHAQMKLNFDSMNETRGFREGIKAAELICDELIRNATQEPAFLARGKKFGKYNSLYPACPACNQKIDSFDPFCRYCGKALDWRSDGE